MSPIGARLIQKATTMKTGTEMTLTDKDRALIERVMNMHVEKGAKGGWYYTDAELAALLSAARDEGRAEGLGGEWVMVPREPTREMLKAAGDYADECARENYGGAPDAEGVWDAMITAAPPASQTQEG